jgi:membrane fusion protein, multidrug efflux system
MNKVPLKITALLSFGVVAASCGGPAQNAQNAANAPVPVNIYRVQAERVTYYDLYPGTVVAMQQVDIHAETEGYLTGMFFKEGAHVSKGQKLYTIDDKIYRASYQQAEAGLRSARSNLEKEQKDADRYVYLDKHDAVAKQVLDHALAAVDAAKDSVRSAEQTLEKARTDLEYSVIRAPFDGTIGISQVKVGNTITIGTTLLNTISTDDPMAVDFVINEKQLPRFINIQKEADHTIDSLFTLLMPNNSLYAYTGQLYLIDRGVDPQTGTIKVRLLFKNADLQLRAGMSCNVCIHSQDTAAQVTVPAKATVEQMGEYFVYVAKDTVTAPDSTGGANKPKVPLMRAEQQKVTLGQTIGDRVIVKSGIKDGDRVIIDGVQKLHDGSLITTANVMGPQAPGKH